MAWLPSVGGCGKERECSINKAEQSWALSAEGPGDGRHVQAIATSRGKCSAALDGEKTSLCLGNSTLTSACRSGAESEPGWRAPSSRTSSPTKYAAGTALW